jgi:IrrE N-terminal-like domain
VKRLDRMAIEEAGPNPQRLAEAIHQQIDLATGPVPVADIAAALDIVEIKEAPLRGLEGALVGPLDRNVGAILLNSHSPPLRRRFTLAHELVTSSMCGIRLTRRAALPARKEI